MYSLASHSPSRCGRLGTSWIAVPLISVRLSMSPEAVWFHRLLKQIPQAQDEKNIYVFDWRNSAWQVAKLIYKLFLIGKTMYGLFMNSGSRYWHALVSNLRKLACIWFPLYTSKSTTNDLFISFFISLSYCFYKTCLQY